MADSDKGHYILIPNEIAFAIHDGGERVGERLNCCERDLLGLICSFSKQGPCKKTNDFFADYIGVGERQIKRFLKSLCEGGFIVVSGKTQAREIVPSEKTIAIYQDLKQSLNQKFRDKGVPKYDGNISFRDKGVPNLGTNMSKFRDKNVPHINIYNNNLKSIGANESRTSSPSLSENKSQKAGKKKKAKRAFIPPTVEEVRTYVNEKGYNVEPEKFVAYYEAGEPAWTDKDGKPIRSWKQKVITWSRKNSGTSKQPSTFVPPSSPWGGRMTAGMEPKLSEEERRAKEQELRRLAGYED